jgi:hypothetical protein
MGRGLETILDLATNRDSQRRLFTAFHFHRGENKFPLPEKYPSDSQQISVCQATLFQSLYTWRIPSGFHCIQAFTQPPHRQNLTYLFIGNYVDNPSGHPLAPLVLTHFCGWNKKHLKGEDSNER